MNAALVFPSPEDALLRKEQVRALRTAVRIRLTTREQIILARRFGFMGEEATLKEIAGEVISPTRVGQIEAKAISKLRTAFRRIDAGVDPKSLPAAKQHVPRQVAAVKPVFPNKARLAARFGALKDDVAEANAAVERARYLEAAIIADELRAHWILEGIKFAVV